MRKDYIAVKNSSGHEAETDFVERFWTKHWDQRQNLGRVAGLVKREEYRIMRPYLDRLPTGARLLDGGCGTGEWTVLFTDQGFETTGLDLSQKTIGRLQELLPDYSFEAGDIRSTGLPEESFEAYFSWGVFEHFENGLQDCLTEAFRLLKPGGLLFASVPFHNARHRWRDLRKYRSWDEFADLRPDPAKTVRFYQWRLTGPELEREFAAAGFETLGLKPIHRNQGWRRCLHHDLRIKYGTKLHAYLARNLDVLFPGRVLAHMILGIGQKPAGSEE